MPLALVHESLDAIEESARAFYKKGDDGKFHLDADIPPSDPNADKNAAELARARFEAGEGRKFKKELAELKATLGENFDIEDYKKLQKEREEAEHARQRREGDWEAREAQLVKRHETELSKANARADRYKAQRDKVMLRDAALQEIVREKGEPKLLLDAIIKRLRVIEPETDDGDPGVQVVDERGRPMVADGKGSDYTIQKLVQDFKGDDGYARAFEPSGLSGGGMLPGSNGGGGRGHHGVDVKNMSGSEILRRIRNGELPTGVPGQRK